MTASAAAHAQEEMRSRRKLTRRTRYRDWAEFGPPPVVPLRPPTAQELREALRQRRLSPTQNSVIQHLRDLAGTQSWCYFSTRGWMKALDLGRTQLLRARRQLIEMGLVYYREFPPEPEPPYLDQPDCGWIGFYPPTQWQPRTKISWGGSRLGAGRPKSQTGCDNLISAEKSSQGSCENLFFLPSDHNQIDTEDEKKAYQIFTASLAPDAISPAADTPALIRDETNKRLPISVDIDAADAALGFCSQEMNLLTPLETCTLKEAEQRVETISLASDVGAAGPARARTKPTEQNRTRMNKSAQEELAIWREELREAKKAEQQAWKELETAQTALDRAGHGLGSDRSALMVARNEASPAYHYARDRREAYALIIGLVETGTSKQEAIEHALVRYPHLRKESQDSRDPEVVAETGVETFEAWPLLTGVQWQRALFGQFCRLWNWPTDKKLNPTARGRLNTTVKSLQAVQLRPEYIPLFVAWWKREYPWRMKALPWELAASVNDFQLWQKQHQAWEVLSDPPGRAEAAEASTTGETSVEVLPPPHVENIARPERDEDSFPDDLVTDPVWIAQLCQRVPDAESRRDDCPTRDVHMLWSFVRDALRSGLNTARRQHLDALVPAWNPANPRELVLLASTSYTIRFVNMAMLREINAEVSRLLGRFFEYAQLVYVSQEVIEQVKGQSREVR